MKASELRAKSEQELQDELVSLYREQFNLRMQRGAGQQPKPHLFKLGRRNIARVKMIMHEKLVGSKS